MTVWRLAIFIKSAHLRCEMHIQHHTWCVDFYKHTTHDIFWHMTHCPISISNHDNIFRWKFSWIRSHKIQNVHVVYQRKFRFTELFICLVQRILFSITLKYVGPKKPPLEKWCEDNLHLSLSWIWILGANSKILYYFPPFFCDQRNSNLASTSTSTRYGTPSLLP